MSIKVIRESIIFAMIDKMVDYSDTAELAKMEATQISDSYVQQVGTKYKSVGVAEIAASEDREFKVKVAKNQMYDRLATRHASVIQAIVGLVQVGALEIRDDEYVDNMFGAGND